MNDWVEQVEKNIERRKLFGRNERILVAVSGGLDSMVLLHLLHTLSNTHSWKIVVAHFNHKLRGRSGDADERFVHKASEKLGTKCFSESAKVKAFAGEKGISIEMAARELRHQFLARTAKKLKIRTIALAHHADDQVELFFLRVLRGSGSEGLVGMRWKSKSPADSSLQLVRPLLNQPKKALLNFATSQQIAFREDASNASPDFQRNRIRQEVVPLLKKMQPAFAENVLRTMDIIEKETDFISSEAEKWLKNRHVPFSNLHVAVQRVCLRLQLRRMGLPGSFELIEQIREQSDVPIAVNPKLSVFRDGTGIVHSKKAERISFQREEIEIDLSAVREVVFGGKMFSWLFETRKDTRFSPEQNTEWFDADKVGHKIRLRCWREGDRFQPIGMSSAKKLQDIFINSKVPRAERHCRIVATTANGEIFWVEGLRISERFKLDKQTRRRLKWLWR